MPCSAVGTPDTTPCSLADVCLRVVVHPARVATSAECRFSPMGIAQAGVLFFRPCAGIAEHMMRLAQVSKCASVGLLVLAWA
jgi:hypothetical protein